MTDAAASMVIHFDQLWQLCAMQMSIVQLYSTATQCNLCMADPVCCCSDEPNCRVQIKMVDGDHRVAIYAAKDIATGTELLYNYGDKFGAV